MQSYTLSTAAIVMGNKTLQLIDIFISSPSADELKALVADQGWLHARVPASGYENDGYLADLTNAWEDFAHPEALRQIAAGEEPVTIAECMRFALIRTSVNSIAGNYVPELVARAVETGPRIHVVLKD